MFVHACMCSSYYFTYIRMCVCTCLYICTCPVHMWLCVSMCVCACPVGVPAAVVLAGTSGSGKSVCIDTVVATVNSLKHHSPEAAPLHVKLHRLYPVAFESLSALFGQVTPEGDWKDGVFSSLLRKALQVKGTTQ